MCHIFLIHRSWFVSETKTQMEEHLKLPYDKVSV